MPQNQAKLAARRRRRPGSERPLMLTVRYEPPGPAPGRPPPRPRLRLRPPRLRGGQAGRPRGRLRLRRRRAEGGAQHLRRHGRGRRGRTGLAAPAPCRATPPACRSPTAPSTASSPPRCSSTSPTTQAALAELARVLRPGGTMAVTVPAWLPEQVCWELSDEYHAPFVDGGHVRIYRAAELRDRMRARRRRTPASRTTPTRCTRRTGGCAAPSDRPTTTIAPWRPTGGCSSGTSSRPRRVTRWPERRAQPGARQEPRRLREEAAGVIGRSAVPDIDGVLTADEVVETAASHRRAPAPQRHDPVVPRRPLRPVEPRGDGHGPVDVAGLTRRGRAGLRVAVAHATPRRHLVQLLRRGPAGRR